MRAFLCQLNTFQLGDQKIYKNCGSSDKKCVYSFGVKLVGGFGQDGTFSKSILESRLNLAALGIYF